jgi:citrate lyase subunit beta/citryl-CoA lyase
MSVFRSFLFAPANHARRREKAFTLGADAVILDLEDACAIPEKAASRPWVVEAMRAKRDCLGYVRVNALSTPFAHDDIAQTLQPGLDGIVLPKVESAAHIAAADGLIARLERDRGLGAGSVDLVPIIESALGMVNLREIVRASPRVKRVAFGAADYTNDLRLAWTRDELELLPPRSQVVLESRAAGLEAPIDTVWADVRDSEGFARSAQRARGLGFQGKLCIHPDQVGVVNESFTPSEAEVARATRIVEAFDEAEARGSSAIQLDGQFIDYPIMHAARRVLETARAIAARRPA